MLSLSDADLARLRLECWKAIRDQITSPSLVESASERLVAWCLRDKPEHTDLLSLYMAHVIEEEGTSFLGICDGTTFTREQFDALEAIEASLCTKPTEDGK